MNEYKEYDTLMIPISGGREQEFAIMEEFTFEEQCYIVVSPIIGEEIQEGTYLYRTMEADGQVEVEKIEDAEEFAKVCAYYEHL